MSYCVFIQVLGHNLCSDGQYDIVCFFYEKCTWKEDAFKLNDDKWWFVKIFDVCKKRPGRGKGQWQAQILPFQLLS